MAPTEQAAGQTHPMAAAPFDATVNADKLTETSQCLSAAGEQVGKLFAGGKVNSTAPNNIHISINNISRPQIVQDMR